MHQCFSLDCCKLQKGTNIRLPEDGGTFILLLVNGLINLYFEEVLFIITADSIWISVALSV